MNDEQTDLIIPIKHLDDLDLRFEDLEHAPVQSIIFVCDSASEYFVSKISSTKVIVIRTATPGMVGKAIYEGILCSKAKKVVVTMGDGCDSWDDIAKISSLLDSYDIVTTSRFKSEGDYIGGNYHKEIVTKIAARLLKLRWKWNISDPTNNFKGYNRSIFQKIEKIESNGFSIGLEILVKSHLHGLKIIEIATRWEDRATSYRWVKRIFSYMPYLFWWRKSFN